MYDITAPIEIAREIYWVGYVIPDDPFQCHVYLIRNGEESILIDPGSKITWPQTRRKILQLMPLEDIKYFVCQHQDPDITASMEDIFDEIGTENRLVVTHWRTRALLDHYDWGVEFYEVEEHRWKLQAGSRLLEFIFTPYMHFPGNICSYDPRDRILFSSDIFGAFTDTFQLYATDAESYFEQMKPFHTHYMPSKAIVNHGLDNISKYPIETIAPQHGSIIKKEFIPDIIAKLRELDVGLFLEFGGEKDVKFLTRASEIISKIYTLVAYSTNGYIEIDHILLLIRKLFPVTRILSLGFADEDAVLLDSEKISPKKTKWTASEIRREYSDLLRSETPRIRHIRDSLFGEILDTEYQGYLFVSRNNTQDIVGITAFLFDKNLSLGEPQKREVLKNLQTPFEILLTKTLEFYLLEKEKNHFFIESITDSLTGLYNRHYLFESGTKEYANSKRHRYPLSVAMLDLDKFKAVNDTYGHDVGDIVLKDFGRLIQGTMREGDLAYRYGGEEFVILMPHTTAEGGYRLLLRLRKRLIESGGVKIGSITVDYRFSAGIAERTDQTDSLDALIKSADEKLYLSKEAGRDRITF